MPSVIVASDPTLEELETSRPTILVFARSERLQRAMADQLQAGDGIPESLSLFLDKMDKRIATAALEAEAEWQRARALAAWPPYVDVVPYSSDWLGR